MKIHINNRKLFLWLPWDSSRGSWTLQSTTVSAKSRVRVTSNVSLRTDASSRNVTFTGKAALFNKASSLKSAKKEDNNCDVEGSLHGPTNPAKTFGHIALQEPIRVRSITKWLLLTANTVVGFMVVRAVPICWGWKPIKLSNRERSPMIWQMGRSSLQTQAPQTTTKRLLISNQLGPNTKLVVR